MYIGLEVGNLLFDGIPFPKVFICSQIIEVEYNIIEAFGENLKLCSICLCFLDFESDHCSGLRLVYPPYANAPVGSGHCWKWEEGVGCSFFGAFFNYAFEVSKFN